MLIQCLVLVYCHLSVCLPSIHHAIHCWTEYSTLRYEKFTIAETKYVDAIQFRFQKNCQNIQPHVGAICNYDDHHHGPL
jgi:hypothetical protein